MSDLEPCTNFCSIEFLFRRDSSSAWGNRSKVGHLVYDNGKVAIYDDEFARAERYPEYFRLCLHTRFLHNIATLVHGRIRTWSQLNSRCERVRRFSGRLERLDPRRRICFFRAVFDRDSPSGVLPFDNPGFHFQASSESKSECVCAGRFELRRTVTDYSSSIGE